MDSPENSSLYNGLGEFGGYIASAYGAAFVLLSLMLVLTLRYAATSRRADKHSNSGRDGA